MALVCAAGVLFYLVWQVQQKVFVQDAGPSSALPEVGIGSKVVYLPAGDVIAVENGELVLVTTPLPGAEADTASLPAQFRVQIVATTELVAAGTEPKDFEASNKELAAYNAKVRALLEDPEGNRGILEELYQPLPIQTTPITLSEIEPGRRVSVQGVATGDASFKALRVVLMQKQP